MKSGGGALKGLLECNLFIGLLRYKDVQTTPSRPVGSRLRPR